MFAEVRQMYEILVPLSTLDPDSFRSHKPASRNGRNARPRRKIKRRISLLLMGFSCLALAGCGAAYVTTKAEAGASGAAGLSVGASSVSFGSVLVNATATQSVSLTSTGTGPVTISQPAVTGSGFAVSVPGVSFPMTLAAGQAATLEVEFIPTVTGAATGQLVITSNAATDSKAVVALTGSGAPHEVQLAWNAPAASADPVVGYYIFRSTGNGSLFQLVSASGDPQTSYIDTTVQSGTTYEYLVKSYDSSGDESAPSNTISVTIP